MSTYVPNLVRTRRLVVGIGAMCLAVGLTPAAEAASIETGSASPFVGSAECRLDATSPGCLAHAYDTGDNLAFVGNGFAALAIAKDEITCCVTIHQDHFANDGYYGNGASWIAGSSNSWLKVDLGSSAVIDSVRIGRDRIGNFNDRDPGRFRILVADTDVYAAGDDLDDAAEYTLVFDSADYYFYDGQIDFAETLQANIDQARGRYLKLEVTASGTAIDEIEVAGRRIFPATSRDGCKQGGWMNLTDDDGTLFKNQGDCVSFVSSGGKNTAAG